MGGVPCGPGSLCGFGRPAGQGSYAIFARGAESVGVEMQIVLLLAGALSALAGFGVLGYAYSHQADMMAMSLLVPGSIFAIGGLILIGVAGVIGKLDRVRDAILARSAVPAQPPLAASRTTPLPVPPKSMTNTVAKPIEAPVAASALAAAAVAAGKHATEKPPAPAEKSQTSPEKIAEKPMAENRAPLPVTVAPAVPSLSPPHGAPKPIIPDFSAAVASALEEPKASAPELKVSAPIAPPVIPPSSAPPPPVTQKVSADDAPAIIVRAPERPSQAPTLGGVDRDDALLPPGDEDASDLAPPKPAVLKSGVIEGMSYTLYADGSVDAELASGMRHFASIGDWRAHMRGEL